MNGDSLGDRMKEYEAVSCQRLMRRNPVIIRVDGKAFHTFTKGMVKPFDEVLVNTMQRTMQYLCENIQNCVFGYTQSDEITLVLVDYKNINTSPWYDNKIQKMASVTASMATVAFNRFFRKWVEQLDEESNMAWNVSENECAYIDILEKKLDTATFDARVFSVPHDEVANCLIWRQQDATRNSIQSLGQAHFSHKELQGKSCNEIQEMLWQQRDINWNDLYTHEKRGTSCYKVEVVCDVPDPNDPSNRINVPRKVWYIDTETPIFTQDREFIERHI